MKKIVSLMVASAISLSALSLAHAEKVEFTDLTDESVAWAVDYIYDMAELGFVTGYEDGTYQPNKSVTRHEVFALMARVLGCNKDDNVQIVENAVDKYEELLESYSISWGIEEISFLLHKGVLTEKDLATYMTGSLKSEAMPRSEIAVILTKTVGGEEDAKNSSYIMTYNDINNMSTTVRPYIAYVSEKGLMNGMEGGMFSPSTSVLRSQIAAILSRVHDMLDISTDIGVIDTIDEDSQSISYYDSNGMLVWKSYTDAIDVIIDGEPSQVSYLETGDTVVFSFSGDDVISIDVIENTTTKTFTARYISRSVAGGVTRVTLKHLTGSKATMTYECQPGFEMYFEGSPATITSYKDGDYLEVTLVGDKITVINGKEGTEKITGAIVESIEAEPDNVITISHSDPEYDGNTYSISENVVVNKNSKSVLLSDIYAGDTVTLTITYGEVTAITAFSQSKNDTGVIKSYTISSTPSIVVTTNGKDNEYSIAKDIVIEINGAEATIYDLRVGDTISLKLSGSAVTKITATASTQSTNGSVEGEVVAVHSTYGFIKVKYVNASGIEAEETVYCDDVTTNIMNSNGKSVKLKDIKIGSKVSAHGTISSGAFTAKVVVVTE